MVPELDLWRCTTNKRRLRHLGAAVYQEAPKTARADDLHAYTYTELTF